MSRQAINGDAFQSTIARLRRFVSEREWAQFHDPKNLAMAIASEAGELLAELRWVDSRTADAFVREEGRRDALEREVADIAIALLLFCDRSDIDLAGAIDRKIQLNESNYPVGASRGRPDRPDASR